MTKAERSRQLRYKKAALAELGYEQIRDRLLIGGDTEMKGTDNIMPAVIFEIEGGIGNTVSSALAKIILDYARQNPDVLKSRKEDNNAADEQI